MKKTFALLLICITAIFCSQAAFAETYTEIERNDRHIAYLDVDSVHNMGSYMEAVTKIILRADAKARFRKKTGIKADYILLTVAYNKTARQDQVTKVGIFSGNKQVGQDKVDFTAEKWRNIPKATLGDKIYSIIVK